MENWERAEPALRPPPKGTVLCWRVFADALDEALEQRLAGILSDGERLQAARFVQADDRRRFVAAHAALRVLLAAALGMNPRDPAIVPDTGGKPRLPGSGIEFNLSHSGRVVLVALSAGVPVGVDVEFMRPMADRADVAEHFFHPGERSDLRDVPASEAEAAFFACWTRKEAIAKAAGAGLSLPLDQFRVSCRPGEAAVLLAGCDALPAPATWSLFHLEPAAAHVGAIALPLRPASLDCRTLDLTERTSL